MVTEGWYMFGWRSKTHAYWLPSGNHSTGKSTIYRLLSHENTVELMSNITDACILSSRLCWKSLIKSWSSSWLSRHGRLTLKVSKSLPRSCQIYPLCFADFLRFPSVSLDSLRFPSGSSCLFLGYSSFGFHRFWAGLLLRFLPCSWDFL